MTAQPSPRPGYGRRRALSLSVRLYRLLLYAYPAGFRQSYAERMVRVFADQCRAAVQDRGLLALIPLWLSTSCDTAFTAGIERWQAFKEKVGTMSTHRDTQSFPLRLWAALAATLLAFLVALVASLNLYLLEDSSPFSQAAYSASSLLRYSYDAVYLSALAAGVAICAIVGYSLVQSRILVAGALAAVAIVVALGGFGGLLARDRASISHLRRRLHVIDLWQFSAWPAGGYTLPGAAWAAAGSRSGGLRECW